MTRKLAKKLNGGQSFSKKLIKPVEKKRAQPVTQDQANDSLQDGPAPILKLPLKKSPRDYQKLAIEKVVKGFDKADRGQLIMPCGTGKTLVSLWIQEQLSPAYTLVLFPSLALLRQTKDEWARNRKCHVPYMCVCSEKDIDKGSDSPRISLSEIGGNVSTDPSQIRSFLQKHKQAIIFSTYQSLKAVSQALKETNLSFDLAICDEAHKTAGTQKGAYSLIHDNSMIPVSKRLYMTATPRVISQRLKGRLDKEGLPYIADMGDPETFGEELYRMSFKEAIDLGVLVDYKIVAIGVTDAEIQRIIKEGRFTKKGAKIEEIANNYALERFMGHYEASSVITFHSSIKKAGDFKDRHLELFKGVKAFHVNGTQSTKERQTILNEFAGLSQSIVTNARCLTEGVDIPAVDAVFFCDPKNSKIDIVQAAGRALRRADHRNKTMGYIVVPLFHRHEDDLENVIETGVFSNLLNVIRGLSNHDERITEVMRQLKHDKEGDEGSNNRGHREDEFTLIELPGVAESLQTRLFDEVIDNFRLPWKSFEEARGFARGLGLNSSKEWKKYNKSGDKPTDIPGDPYLVYKDKGWVSWGDWLGNGNVATFNKQFRKFEEAREFARSLGLRSGKEWNKYSKSGNKPSDISTYPDEVYKDKGWVSWGDWLGTEYVSHNKRIFRQFEEAREFVRRLNLKSFEQWGDYSKSATGCKFFLWHFDFCCHDRLKCTGVYNLRKIFSCFLCFSGKMPDFLHRNPTALRNKTSSEKI